MERLFRLTANLACVGEQHDLPEGTLAIEPRPVARDAGGADYVFLASLDGGQTWREYSTVIERFDDWFELVGPGQAPETTAEWLRREYPHIKVNEGEPRAVTIVGGVRAPKKNSDG